MLVLVSQADPSASVDKPVQSYSWLQQPSLGPKIQPRQLCYSNRIQQNTVGVVNSNEGSNQVLRVHKNEEVVNDAEEADEDGLKMFKGKG
ncbi:unnamed protein product [Phytophthora lilii]|uniref:Unnamed protein product n=1 Tax=Phytophthora lilii TaxID=2077276 RepID=A0A9W6U7L0_9STRA|nr:unnamed protein product [Phytophthora lilii]